MPVKIFFCYAREDEMLLNRLKSHLRPLQREGLIDVWHDREIKAGSDWEQEIKRHLDEAQIILLMVSSHFMDSDYCYGIEMQRALERHTRGEVKVIPIILRPVFWQVKGLKELQALPTDGKPVTSRRYWEDEDSALYDVVAGIHKVIEALSSELAFPLSSSVETIQQAIIKSDTFSPMTNPVSFSRSVHPFPVEKLMLLRTLTSHADSIRSVAISPDGETLVSGSRDSAIKVWSLSTGKELRTLTNDIGYVLSVAISPDGETLVSGGKYGIIEVWSLSTGKKLRTLTGHGGSVLNVVISSDGETLVSGSSDKTIKIWNLSTGKELRTLTGHTNSVRSIAISPSGETLVSGSKDTTISVWGV